MPLHPRGRANSPAAIHARRVRLLLSEAGMPHAIHLEDITIYKVCRKIAISGVGVDQLPGLVADALVQYPRPGWLETMVGPYPWAYENLNPEDVANPKEWGAGDNGQPGAK